MASLQETKLGIQRRGAEDAEISAEKTIQLFLLLCVFLCALCASALNILPRLSSEFSSWPRLDHHRRARPARRFRHREGQRRHYQREVSEVLREARAAR